MEAPIKKNQEYIVDIIDNGFEGEGMFDVHLKTLTLGD